MQTLSQLCLKLHPRCVLLLLHVPRHQQIHHPLPNCPGVIQHHLLPLEAQKGAGVRAALLPAGCLAAPFTSCPNPPVREALDA
jgi:hypothetical protein